MIQFYNALHAYPHELFSAPVVQVKSEKSDALLTWMVGIFMGFL